MGAAHRTPTGRAAPRLPPDQAYSGTGSHHHGSGTGHAALSSWPVADQNRQSRDYQQNQQLAAWQTNSQLQQRNGYTAAWQDEFQPQQRSGYTDYNQPLGHAWARGGFGDLRQNQPLVHARARGGYAAYSYTEDFNGRRADEGHWPRAENEHERAAQRWQDARAEHERAAQRWQDARAAKECAHARRIHQFFSGGQADEGWQRAEAENERSEQRLASDALLTGGSRAEAPREQLSLSLLPGTPAISYRLRRRLSYL